jgi:multiple antibiotic resistance protein
VIDTILYIFSTLVAIFVVVDPFAVVPVYLSVTARFTPEEIKHTRKRATLVASGVLITFAVTGMSIFKIFGITLPAFQIAGGILILLFGIAQLNGTRARVKPEERLESLEREDVSVFPIGTPLLAGPGAISTVVLLATQAKSPWRIVGLVVAIMGAMAVTFWVLKGAGMLLRVLGQTGLNLFTRLMGIILTSLAIQFIINGIQEVLKVIHAAGT